MKKGTTGILKRITATLVAVIFAGYSTHAGSIAIINGFSTTSESGTTADITANLASLQARVGNTTTIFDTPPASLAGFSQVWDIRFSNSSPLTSGVQTEYESYLQSGHAIFVMGENSGFATRNNSLVTFVSLLGGGSLTLSSVSDMQTVLPPFDSGIAGGSITFSAAGSVATPGKGKFMTSTTGGGTGVVWNTGTLSNAPAGNLTMVLDVNFMQALASEGEMQFLKNLVGYVTSVSGGGGKSNSAPLTVVVGPTFVLVQKPSSILTLAQLLADEFEKISPQGFTSIPAGTSASALALSQSVQQRTDDLRSGSNGFSAVNFAINGDGPRYSGPVTFRTGSAGPSGPAVSEDGKMVKDTKATVPGEDRWGAFLTGTGQWVNVDGTDNARGYELESGGITLGLDYKVGPHLAIGVAAGYTGTVGDLANDGRVWTNGGKIGLYGTAFTGGWYMDASAFGGYNSYDSRRDGLGGTARGSTDGGELDALFGAGYDFKKGHFSFGPTASFNYTYLAINGFTEHGSLLPLNIHDDNVDSLTTAFGIKASYDWSLGHVMIKPELRAAWQHQYGDSSYAVESSFASGPAGNFTVNGPRLGRDSALVGAGFVVQLSERCNTYFYYDGELGRKNYLSTTISGGLRLAF